MQRFFFNSILVAFLAATASASIAFTYSTTGSYTPGTGAVDNTSTFNLCATTNFCVDWAAGTNGTDPVYVELVYVPVVAASGNATRNDNFGSVQLFCVDTTTNTSDTNCTGGTAIDGDLTIAVNQTVPDGESHNFVDVLTGSNTAGGTVSFGTATFNTDGGLLTYTLQTPANYLIDAVGDGATSLQGTITANSIPEPATLSLMGAGLLGLGFVARRRKA